MSVFTTTLSPSPSPAIATGAINFNAIPVSVDPIYKSSPNGISIFYNSTVSSLWNLGLNVSVSGTSLVSSVSVNFPGAVTSTNWDIYAVYFPFLTEHIEGPDTKNNGSCSDILVNNATARVNCRQLLAGAALDAITRPTVDYSGWTSFELPQLCSDVYGNTTRTNTSAYVIKNPTFNTPFLYRIDQTSSSNFSAVQARIQQRIWPVLIWERDVNRTTETYGYIPVAAMKCLQAVNGTTALISSPSSTSTLPGTTATESSAAPTTTTKSEATRKMGTGCGWGQFLVFGVVVYGFWL